MSKLLCISQSFTPSTTPTAIRAGKLVEQLAARHEVLVLTESTGTRPQGRAQVQEVRSRRPARVLALLRRLRMDKLIELMVWPDDSIFWVLPAIRAARRAVRESRPEAIVVFMMPYSSGLVGLALKRLTGLPLVLNLDDSPTCTDMHPHYPTRLHYRMARSLENRYVRRADAVVYVSRTNLELVAERQRDRDRSKLHLVRYGADPSPPPPGAAPPAEGFRIAYVGAMSGWWSTLDGAESPGLAERLYGAWSRLGRYERMELDQRTSSPAVIGRAILSAIGAHPGWEGRVALTIYGNPYPAELVERSLERCGIADVVTVLGAFPHEEVSGILARADLLFITLPDRPDGSRGGRISAKTYEYLATDRPILAAVPPGENWDYLEGKPGVWLAEPGDEQRMAAVISSLAEAKFAGQPMSFDRAGLAEELSYRTRAAEFESVIAAAGAGR